MRNPLPDCCTIFAFWQGRGKRINTEGTAASAQSTQRRAELPVPAPAIAGRFATSYALLLASTVFLGAFLLFLVEPLFAKLILPRFGGAAAVWAACLVFFQCALLLGYLYADLTSRRLTPARQSQLHIALLLLSLVFLPIARRGIAPAAAAASEQSEAAEAPSLREKLLWLGLSACSSMLLLSITNKLLEDVAPVPLLWVLPLALYLLTFALAFS